jgi:molecular chaperone DnaJ
MSTNPWSILEIAEASTLDDAKKAYRRLARKYHPDVNSDPTSRQRFERISWAIKEVETFHSGSTLQAAKTAPRMDDSVTRVPVKIVNLSFAQSFDGLETELIIAVPQACSNCGGTGMESADGRFCGTCRGFGKRLGENGSEVCPECSGSGFSTLKNCTRCEGGTVTRSKAYEVSIPAGVADGARLQALPRDDPNGPKATIIVRVASSGLWERRGESPDLMLELPLTFSEACLGAQVNVPTPDKAVALKVPEGTPSGKIFRIPGRGMPTGEGERGDLYVRTTIVVPGELSSSQKKALQEFSKQEQDPRKHFFAKD